MALQCLTPGCKNERPQSDKCPSFGCRNHCLDYDCCKEHYGQEALDKRLTKNAIARKDRNPRRPGKKSREEYLKHGPARLRTEAAATRPMEGDIGASAGAASAASAAGVNAGAAAGAAAAPSRATAAETDAPPRSRSQRRMGAQAASGRAATAGTSARRDQPELPAQPKVQARGNKTMKETSKQARKISQPVNQLNKQTTQANQLTDRPYRRGQELNAELWNRRQMEQAL